MKPLPRQQLLDVLVAGGFVVAGQLELRSNTGDGSAAGGVWLNSLVSLLVCAPLAIRHARPLAALSASCLELFLASLGWAHSMYFWTDLLPLTLLVWTAASAGNAVAHRWCWTLPVLATCSDMVRLDSARDPANVMMAILLYAGSGGAARLVDRYVEQRRRLREALILLEAEQARQAHDAVGAERVRIVDEIHDVVAQAVGVMVVQIGAARLGLEHAGVDVPVQLSAAERSARTALTDLRAAVDVQAPDVGETLAPMPGLTQVHALVERFREAGLAVELSFEARSDLGSSLQLTIYRVLQEALTNAAKHADPPWARAIVRTEEAGVLVEVVNGTTRSAPARLPRGGHGLVGMRERVHAFGGRLEAGPTENGYRTCAFFPVTTPVSLTAGPVA